MAMITLGRVWINLLATGESINAYSSDRSRGTGINGTVNQYAGGRFRPTTIEGVRGSFAFKLRDVTELQIETLKTWYGQPVVVRDHRGRVYFAVFFNLAETERRDTSLYDVALTIEEITYTLGVV